jgi:hypothetical protein
MALCAWADPWQRPSRGPPRPDPPCASALTHAATLGRSPPAPAGRAPLPAPDPTRPPSILLSTWHHRANPPIFLPRRRPSPVPFPLGSNHRRPMLGAAPRHRTASASELAVHGEPRPSAASACLCHLELLQQGAATEHHGAQGPARPRRVDVLHALVPDPPQLHPSVPHFGEPTP